MARAKKPLRVRAKPLLACAVICDRVLEGDDGSMSVICTRDQVKLWVPDNADPETKHPISLWALISFKSGEVVGERMLRLVMRTPLKKRRLVREQMITLNGAETGFNLRLSIEMRIKTPGLYWLDVFLERTRVTSMPLRVIIERQPHNTGSDSV
jgi:hypothetical protein